MMDDQDVPPADDEREGVDPDHPLSTVQCDHPDCTNESPGPRRICEHCTLVMHPSQPDECAFCGASL